MNIGLLNLPVDNNYGGNLQRYALIKVLQDMGHDVTHLNLRFSFNPYPWYTLCYIVLRRLASRIIKRNGCDIFPPEYRYQNEFKKKCAVTDIFYNRYVKHTKPIYNKQGLKKNKKFDAFIVGSDQVWRKKIASFYGISTFFFDFLPYFNKTPLIAYGVSLGTNENELNHEDLYILTPLYKKFKAISVREESALKLFKTYGWTKPKAIQVLDPTLLLSKEDYIELINAADTEKPKGNLFCYILDNTKEKDLLIRSIATEKGLTPFYISIEGHQPTVEQWLRSFMDSEYVITDSFHGFVFSLIFNKPFHLINNDFRGNARFDSIKKTILNGCDIEHIDWSETNKRIEMWKKKSMQFLEKALDLKDRTFMY